MVVPESYKKVLRRFIRRREGVPVHVLAVLKMDELVDKWSVIVALEGVDQKNRKEIFSDLISSLQSELESEELSEIARVALYAPDDHLMQLFYATFKEGQYIQEDAKVNGNIIHEGYIIALRPTDATGIA